MNYSNLILDDFANGKGVRTTLFVSGCLRHCPGCFNRESWDFNYGEKFTEKTMEKIFNSMDEYHDGITILGGEPLEPQNVIDLAEFLREFKILFPNKTIWVYTGYIYESLKGKLYDTILSYIDILVDGPFIEELKDSSLKFRGSSNQRIIDVKKTKEEKNSKVVLYEE